MRLPRYIRKESFATRNTQHAACSIVWTLWWTHPPMITETQAFSNSTRLMSPTNRATRFATPDEPRPQVGARRPRVGDLDRTVPRVLRHERRFRALCLPSSLSRGPNTKNAAESNAGRQKGTATNGEGRQERVHDTGHQAWYAYDHLDVVVGYLCKRCVHST